MPVTRKRIRGLLLEALIGSAIVAAILLYAVYGPFRWMPSLRWWGLAGETAVVFGYIARAMHRYWKIGRFWAGFLGFLAVHLVACVALLLNVQQFGLLWFVFIGYGEWVALAYLLDLLLREATEIDSRRQHKTP